MSSVLSVALVVLTATTIATLAGVLSAAYIQVQAVEQARPRLHTAGRYVGVAATFVSILAVGAGMTAAFGWSVGFWEVAVAWSLSITMVWLGPLTADYEYCRDHYELAQVTGEDWTELYRHGKAGVNDE